MATSKGNGSGAGKQRRGKNNDPAGRNQNTAKGSANRNPLAVAAVAGGAMAAGAFLWSRRSQIRNQVENFSGPVSDWRESMSSNDGSGEKKSQAATVSPESGRRSQTEIAEEALTLKETGRAT